MNSSLRPRDFGPILAEPGLEMEWSAQRPLFYMRFFHLLVYLGYIGYAGGIAQGLLPLGAVLGGLALYFVATTSLFFSTARHGPSEDRVRFALRLDLAMLFVAYCHDPYASAPTVITGLIVLLGNGLRHGARYYRESALLLLGLIATAIVLRAQFTDVGFPPVAGFTVAFTLICGAYGYLLVSRLWATREALENQNRFDDITGLFSRRSLREAADQALKRCRRHEDRCALLYLDLDNFKQVNDRHGHAEGDAALLAIADALAKVFKPPAIFGRHGGDEFVAIFPGYGEQAIEGLIRRAEEAVADAAIRWPNVQLGVSVGSAIAPMDGLDYDTLLWHADRNMYRRKRFKQMVHHGRPRRRLRRPRLQPRAT